MITKEQYDEALLIVELYEDQRREEFNKLKTVILDKIHERTADTDWYIEWVDSEGIELSHREYDEDYGGAYDKYFKQLGEEYGVRIKVDYGLYGK